jgi:AcrR family transcriptional regulator
MCSQSSQPQERCPARKLKAAKTAGERVFEVAADLFYRESIRAVGVDTIVKQAGVAKISLYRNFESKDDLIVAYLENRNSDYWRNIDRLLAAKGGDPRTQLRALISYVAGSHDHARLSQLPIHQLRVGISGCIPPWAPDRR